MTQDSGPFSIKQGSEKSLNSIKQGSEKSLNSINQGSEKSLNSIKQGSEKSFINSNTSSIPVLIPSESNSKSHTQNTKLCQSQNTKLCQSQNTKLCQSQNTKLCQICFQVCQKYKCPKCFIFYCSLECFKSEIHLEKFCIENNFYIDQIQNCLKVFHTEEYSTYTSFITLIRAQLTVSRYFITHTRSANCLKELKVSDIDQKAKMLNILKKFQHEKSTSLDDLDDLDEKSAPLDDLDEKSNVQERFRNVDFESTPLQELYSKLTKKEVENFEFLLANNLDVLIEPWQPWWSAAISTQQILLPNNTKERNVRPTLIIEHQASPIQAAADNTPAPPITNVPPLPSTFKYHADLCFGILDLVLSYVATCRTFNGDIWSNPSESSPVLLQFSHILSTTPSSFVYQSVHQVMDVSLSCMLSDPEWSISIESFQSVFVVDLITVLEGPRWILCSLLSDMANLLSSSQLPSLSRSRFVKYYVL